MSNDFEPLDTKGVSRVSEKLEKVMQIEQKSLLKQVDVVDLLPGMFITELDIPWSLTPFSMDGFAVDKDNLSTVKSYCKTVTIDLVKSELDQFSLAEKSKPIRHKSILIALPKFDKAEYKIKWSIKAECNRLRREETILKAYRMLMLQGKLATLRRPLDVPKFETAAKGIVTSVLNNPNGLLWELNKNVPLLTKPIISNTLMGAVVAAIMARHFGWPVEQIENICQGMLMRHMGLLASSPTMKMLFFEKNDKDIFLESEQILMRLTAKQKVNDYVMTVVQNFNERYNGTGIPNKLELNQIPFMAKVAGVADYYSRIVSPVISKTPKLPFVAMQLVMSTINKEFDQRAVDCLTSSVGIYPARSFVKLTNGVTAVVTEQTNKKLFPKLTVLLKANGKPPFFNKVIDLSTQKKSEQLLIVSAVDASVVKYKEGLLAEYDIL